MSSALEVGTSFVELMRCAVCGIRLYSEGVSRCEWCEDPMVHNLLHSLLEHVDEFLANHEPATPREDLGMSFITDIGELAARHTYFTSLAKILTLLIERGAVKRISDAERIWGDYLMMEAKRVLPLFAKVGLCSFKVDGNGHIQIEWPPGSIIKRANAWLQTESGRNETASFLLGYILLHALDETMEILDSQKKLAFGQGIARLYPVEYRDGKPSGLRMPKGITAVVSFILGSWARGWNEFDEFTLHKFLDYRGLTGREYTQAVGLLSQTVPGISHSLVEFETYSNGGVPVKRFRYSEPVRNLRDRLIGRARERGERA